ncbi:MAG: ABC transporter ATP-binding protein [Nitrospirales bacterium]|nr:MAG: ABC transporter ATP-binding protein [Nitrospirales bacterium]
MIPMPQPLLELTNLSTSFFSDKGEIRAVEDVSFSIQPGETLALVGESGCGKSVTAFSIMRLVDRPGRIVGGKIVFKGQNLLDLPEQGMRKIRGKSIGMIFQEPMTSLNPVFTIGNQIGETLQIHTDLSASDIRKEVLRLLDKVRIPSPERRIDQYPHEMSGGMKQRVMIAMALACKPDLLIADEPTTALDVTIQAQILDLLKSLQEEMGMAILLITHNLGVVAQFSQNVIVMYASKIAERASVAQLFSNPSHPYTKALLNSLPRPGERGKRLESIRGTVPSPLQYPKGCHFSTRCLEVLEHCSEQPPPLIQVGSDHETSCWLHA